MRLSSLLREAIASARAGSVPTVLVAVLVASMCLAATLTVGRAAAAQERVQERMDEAGSRELQVTDVRGTGFISASVVEAVAGMSSVERVVGLSLPTDVTNLAVGRGGEKVPAWEVTGALADAVELTGGRWPGPGEALVSEQAQGRLGLDAWVGAVSDGSPTVAIVGQFRARPPFTDLDAGIVVASDGLRDTRTLDVVVRSADEAEVTQSAILGLLARTDPSDLSVVSPERLAEVQVAVVGDLARYNRSLMLLVLGMGALLVVVVVLSDVLLHRKDLGRRRALGASRTVIIALVVGRVGVGSVAGALVAVLLGLLVGRLSGEPAPVSFVAGSALLAVLTAAVASIPPSVVAARQDPVRVLRTA